MLDTGRDRVEGDLARILEEKSNKGEGGSVLSMRGDEGAVTLAELGGEGGKG